jgi:hypothetical protein
MLPQPAPLYICCACAKQPTRSTCYDDSDDGVSHLARCVLFLLCGLCAVQVDLLMSERKEAKEAVQAQGDAFKAAQVRGRLLDGGGVCWVDKATFRAASVGQRRQFSLARGRIQCSVGEGGGWQLSGRGLAWRVSGMLVAHNRPELLGWCNSRSCP